MLKTGDISLKHRYFDIFAINDYSLIVIFIGHSILQHIFYIMMLEWEDKNKTCGNSRMQFVIMILNIIISKFRFRKMLH